ncbi:HSPB1-associated protein 1-like [Homarus americanus]|uniref:HSPB1-associated protein 1-like n=1 Tax=Homarus americanus TaxID=6706 RepID=UPI001C494E6F|nr:HSPB1-associated protein 1-like [Homarus americanus]
MEYCQSKRSSVPHTKDKRMAEPLFKRVCQDPGRWLTDNTTYIDPNAVRNTIIHGLSEPLVFRSYLTPRYEGQSSPHWKCMQWDPADWGKLFKETVLKFRIGTRVKEKNLLSAPQWEASCSTANMTFSEFLQWSRGERTCLTSCKQKVNCDDHWAYFDYFYMKDLDLVNQMKGVLDWSLFGYSDRGVKDSTLWIGTPGANTPCHIDTYGCNLVAQVIGRKRWVLFPKSQSQYLSPTRIPYEESSIYSEVGFPCPSLVSHPKLQFSTPYVVTLEPGDVLFVPRQWWHFVENLDFAVSVNTWLELPSDCEERIKESLVMFQVASLCQGVHSLELISSVFNPNMMDVATMTSSEVLKILAHRVFQSSDGRHTSVAEGGDKNATLGGKTSKERETAKQLLLPKDGKSTVDEGVFDVIEWRNDEWCVNHNIERVASMSFSKYMHLVVGCDEEESKMLCVDKEKVRNKTKGVDISEDDSVIQCSQLKLLVDAFTDQRVIDMLKTVIDEKLEIN